MKVTLNSIRHKEKSVEKQKTSFPKGSVENAVLYKPVLSKIMTTHKQCVKYNFVAPLNSA